MSRKAIEREVVKSYGAELLVNWTGGEVTAHEIIKGALKQRVQQASGILISPRRCSVLYESVGIPDQSRKR